MKCKRPTRRIGLLKRSLIFLNRYGLLGGSVLVCEGGKEKGREGGGSQRVRCKVVVREEGETRRDGREGVDESFVSVGFEALDL